MHQMQLESARASFANASAVVHSGHLPTSPGLVLPQEQVVAEGAVAEVETPLQAEVVDSLKRCSTRNTQKKKRKRHNFRTGECDISIVQRLVLPYRWPCDLPLGCQ